MDVSSTFCLLKSDERRGNLTQSCGPSILLRHGGQFCLKSPVSFVRQYKFVLLFLLLLVFCSVMVILQIDANQKRHVEIREAFILLHTRGYTNQAQKLYHRLLLDLPELSDRALLDDFHRTLLLVDPNLRQPSNHLVWNYHWTVSNELDRRSESTLMRAIKLAEEQ